MIKVITYGTFDLLHQGHLNILRRARSLGDYLIVGVTSDTFDINRGKTNVHQSVMQRVEAVRQTGLADEIIIEDQVGQKISDIQGMDIDIFAIGSDWMGKFDYLSEYCQVVYLRRTDGISSTMLRAVRQPVVRLGIIGSGRVAKKFVLESASVIGVQVESVFNPIKAEADTFRGTFGLGGSFDDLDLFLEELDAVYIASPHLSHYRYAKQCLLADKHVLCEIPLTLSEDESAELFTIAKGRQRVLLEASKTAFCPGFMNLVNMVKSGVIGEVVDFQASLSKLQDRSLREFDPNQAGGSMTELSPLALMAMLKILGMDVLEKRFYSSIVDGIDLFVRCNFVFKKAVATITLGLGIKTEGNLVISGTKGYIYVPAPWWKTSYFELRFEDQNLNQKYFYPFLGEGLRYELEEFIRMVEKSRLSTFKLRPQESICISRVIESFRNQENLTTLI